MQDLGAHGGLLSAALPEPVERFVRRYIHSVGELEVLLLLARAPARWWSADAINQELRASIVSARRHLKELIADQLIERRGSDTDSDALFSLRAADPATTDTVRMVAQLFKYRMPALIDLIYGPSAAEPVSGYAPFPRRRDGSPACSGHVDPHR
jgi:hypothetical protein